MLLCRYKYNNSCRYRQEWDGYLVERFVQSVGHARYSDAYSDIKGSKKTRISSKKN